MKLTTGSDFWMVTSALRKVGVATRCRRGALSSTSVRSLLGPGWRTSLRRSAIVGRAAATSGRSWRRSGASRLVEVELVDQVVGGAGRGVEVARRLVGLAASALVLLRRALDHLLEADPGPGVERVEQLVEVDRRRGLGGGKGGPVLERRRAVRPRRERDVAVRDARQRRLADHRLGPLVQRRELVE